LALGHKEKDFIFDFQKENNLFMVDSLFMIFNILHCLQFSFDDFENSIIYLIKNYKWRINNESTVLNAFINHCKPIRKEASCSDIDSIQQN
jgi:hypothetical protein